MPLPYLGLVRMKSDDHRADGVEPGAIGVVVEVFDEDAYEVEFSDEEGITIALLTLGRDDVDLVGEPAATSALRSAG